MSEPKNEERQPLSAEEAVRSRHSCRTYTGNALKDSECAEIRQAISDAVFPFGGNIRFDLISRNECASADLGMRATYGVIRNAPAYICGAAASPDRRTLLSFGFAMESLILKAVSIGLGTCWLGATFSQHLFSRAMRITEEEEIPCVAAVGEPTEKPGLRDRIFRFFSSSASRKNWEELFFEESASRPLNVKEAGNAASALELLRLAPSALNAQEWRVIRTGGGKRFELYLWRQRGKAAARRQKGTDFALIDAGIAMCHFQEGARASKFPGSWSVEEPFLAVVPDNMEPVAVWR